MVSRLMSRFQRRVPVMLQMSATECGAATLAMLASYLGYPLSVRDASKICHVGRDGVTAGTITRAARVLGLRVKSYRAEPEHLSVLPLPAIIHWNFNHFVVLERLNRDSADIVDPAIGRRNITTSEFRDSFTGIIITIERGANFQITLKDHKPFWWRYLSHLGQLSDARAALVQIIFSLIILQLLGLVIPALTQILVDNILPLKMPTLMTILGFGILLTIGMQSLISFVRLLILMRLQIALDSHVMLGFFEHLLRLPYRFFQQRATGDLLMRVSSNVLIRETLSNQVLSVLFDVLFALSYLIILMLLSLPFALATLGLGFVQCLIIFSTFNRLRRLNEQHINAQAQAQSYMVEVLGGISTLKASGGESLAYQQWTDLFFKELSLGVQRNTLSGSVEMITGILRLFAPLILLWMGAWSVLNGSISLGQLLAWNALAIAFLLPINSLVKVGQQLQLVRTYLDRIEDVVDTPTEQAPENPIAIDNFLGDIRLENIHFRYNGHGQNIVNDVSLHIEAGQKVALVGATGSGKSTLASLIVGLNQPTSGEIYYDGVPQSQIYLDTLRSYFGVVLQENFLFNSSIRANIAFYNPHAALEDVITVAKLALIHDEIRQMPMGYETIVGEGGQNLSGGQRQRVALARAIMHDPKVLLLDEATSHLDTITEMAVDSHLSELNCTRIVIAHRLSTIMNADCIVCLHQGRIIEQGKHEDLLTQGGYYYRLHCQN